MSTYSYVHKRSIAEEETAAAEEETAASLSAIPDVGRGLTSIYKPLVNGPPINGAFAVSTWNNTIDAAALGGTLKPGDRITLEVDIGTLSVIWVKNDSTEEHFLGRDKRASAAGLIRTGIRLSGDILQHRGVDSPDGTIQWVMVERPLGNL